MEMNLKLDIEFGLLKRKNISYFSPDCSGILFCYCDS